MRFEEFIRIILQSQKREEPLEVCQKGLPLGLDLTEEVVFSKKNTDAVLFRHTCVTGPRRNDFLKRLLITLSCLYEKDEACFLALSTNPEYADLMRLKNIDVTVPYIRNKEDLLLAKTALKELLELRETGKGYPKLFLILGDLERLPACNEQRDLQEYREIFDMLSRKKDVEVLTCVDLLESVFAGYPGAFIGVNNCLVSAYEEGKADVTYVQNDTSLSQPIATIYPSIPTLEETIIYLNALVKNNEV